MANVNCTKVFGMTPREFGRESLEAYAIGDCELATRKIRVCSSKPTTNGTKMEEAEAPSVKVFRPLAKKHNKLSGSSLRNVVAMKKVKMEVLQASRPVFSLTTERLSTVCLVFVVLQGQHFNHCAQNQPAVDEENAANYEQQAF